MFLLQLSSGGTYASFKLTHTATGRGKEKGCVFGIGKGKDANTVHVFCKGIIQKGMQKVCSKQALFGQAGKRKGRLARVFFAINAFFGYGGTRKGG